TGFLKVKGKKMAKSLGNFITIQNALKDYDAETLRLFFSSTHYRSPIDFYEKGLDQARRTLESLYKTLDNIRIAKKSMAGFTEDEKALERKMEENKREFREAMDDDFNTPFALSYLYDLIKEVNKFLDEQKSINKRLTDKLVVTFKELGGIFGILQREEIEEEIPEELRLLIEERERARERKDWKTADEIRRRLEGFDIILEDTPQGVKWKKKV
ncbi:MAG: class I tRNA ligase family protein, partial [archaeon]|nr:class I tRNA ligase family protein [archaeon]